MLDHHTRELVGWVCGDRSLATGQEIIAQQPTLPSHIYADHFPAYREIAGAIPLTQTKSKTYQIEQNNGRQRRWLASFHRRSMVVTRSVAMLQARLKLFARYRINGSIQELLPRWRNHYIPQYLS